MKFYFASRFKHRDYLRDLDKDLEKLGHKIVSSWIWMDSQKPYDKNHKKCSEISKVVENDIKNCDTFVLISDVGGTDMFVELGIAIAFNKKIYVVGDHNDRSLMCFHPNIERVKSIKDIKF